MEKKVNEMIESINMNRAKIHYRLNQLESMTGLSVRSLKYRMKKVKEKYKDIPSLLFKIGREWQIHYTLLDEFMPIYKKKETNLTNHKWETLIGWNMKRNYDLNYHTALIKEVKEELPKANIAYVIEKDGRGFNHLHAVIDEYKNETEVAVRNVIEKYLERNGYIAKIEKINNRGSAINYLMKQGEINII